MPHTILGGGTLHGRPYVAASSHPIPPRPVPPAGELRSKYGEGGGAGRPPGIPIPDQPTPPVPPILRFCHHVRQQLPPYRPQTPHRGAPLPQPCPATEPSPRSTAATNLNCHRALTAEPRCPKPARPGPAIGPPLPARAHLQGCSAAASECAVSSPGTFKNFEFGIQNRSDQSNADGRGGAANGRQAEGGDQSEAPRVEPAPFTFSLLGRQGGRRVVGRWRARAPSGAGAGQGEERRRQGSWRGGAACASRPATSPAWRHLPPGRPFLRPAPARPHQRLLRNGADTRLSAAWRLHASTFASVNGCAWDPPISPATSERAKLRAPGYGFVRPGSDSGSYTWVPPVEEIYFF